MKKNAYLILVHSDSLLLKRLLEHLGDKDDIFIHVDKKSDIKKFQENIVDEHINFIEDRHDISWGGFSMVEAMISLLSTAVSKYGYEHLIFLSGADYPIKNADYIRNYFMEHPEKEFIRAYSITDSPCEHCHKKIREYHFFNSIFKNRRIDILTRNFLKVISLPFKKRRLIIDGQELNISFGSQWFAITDECARYILEYISNNEQIKTFFKTVFAPDEMFFHTIIFNSKFYKMTTMGKFDQYNHNWNLNNYHWLNTEDLDCNDYGSLNFLQRIIRKLENRKENPSKNGSIAFLNEEKYTDIIKSPYLFARKLNTSYSKNLIEKIDIFLKDNE